MPPKPKPKQRAKSAGSAHRQQGDAAGAAAEGIQGPGAATPGRRGSRATAVAAPAEAAAAAVEPQAAESSDTASEGAAKKPHRKRAKVEAVPPLQVSPCFAAGSSVRVGTSGYTYKHWSGAEGFYRGLPQRLEFDSYALEYDFAELNSTHYG